MKNKILLVAAFLLLCLLGFTLYDKQARATRGHAIIDASVNPPSWMMGQIQIDLSPFTRESFSEESLADLYKKLTEANLLAARVKIQGGVVSLEASKGHPRVNKMRNFLTELSKTVSLPNLECVFYLEDRCDHLIIGPILTFSKKRSLNGILFPDFEATSKIKKASLNYPWNKKRPLIFWRGSFNNLLGRKLVELSNEYPLYVDARFEEGQIDTTEQVKNRYLIDTDTCTSHSHWILFSNSLLLKVTSENIQWYTNALNPYEHYLPIAPDLSDLLNQREWAEQNPERCIEMVEQAFAFAEQSLTPQAIYLYTYLLFQEYAKRQRQ